MAELIVAALVFSSPGIVLEDHSTIATACPAGRPLTRCEHFLFNLGKTWMQRAHEEHAKLARCARQLSHRTPDAVAAATPPPPPPADGLSWPAAAILLSATAVLATSVGVLVGLHFSGYP